MNETIMHQLAHEPAAEATGNLEREWSLFQRIETGDDDRFLLTWEAARPAVVLGRSAPEAEVDRAACRRDGVPILRRRSGGGTVLVGPGCLNYAIVLSIGPRPWLGDVATAFREILAGVAGALRVDGLEIRARTDLVLGGRKVSGNAQRRGRRAVLHHGTLLYDFDPALVDRYLAEPARRPAYRGERTHAEFMGNLPLPAAALRERLVSLAAAFSADGATWPSVR